MCESKSSKPSKRESVETTDVQFSMATDGVTASIDKKIFDDAVTSGVSVPDEKEWVRLFGPMTALGNGGLYGTETWGARENGLAWQRGGVHCRAIP